LCLCSFASAACNSDGPEETNPASEPITLRGDVQMVTNVADTKPGVFIPPYVNCQKPGEGDQGSAGEVCTHVAISGCTEPGKSFSDYASCDVART
jgi:hypothetical protein